MTETPAGRPDGGSRPQPGPSADEPPRGLVVDLDGADDVSGAVEEVDRGYFQGGWEFAENSDGTWMLRFVDIDGAGVERTVFAYLVEDPASVVELRDALGEIYETMTGEQPPGPVGTPSRGGVLARLRKDGRMALANSAGMRITAILLLALIVVLLVVALFRNAFG